MVGRIAKDDASAPAELDGYWFYHRYEAGKEYPYYCRTQGKDGPEEILLNGPELAAEHEFWRVGAWETSPDHALLAWSEDIVSRRQYRIRVRNLTTGKLQPEVIENTTGSIAWANDNSFFYVRRNPESLRSEWVYRHVLGTDPSEDTLVFHESDPTFYLGVSRSPSNRFIVIDSWSTLTTEYNVVPTDAPTTPPRPVIPRERGHEYHLAHEGDVFYIRTNKDAINFRLVEAPLPSSADPSTWREILPHQDDVLLHDMFAFERHLVVNVRRDGIRCLRVLERDENGHALPASARDIELEESTYTTRLGRNFMTRSSTLRFAYTSLTTPVSDIAYDLETGALEVLKREPVLGDFDPDDYVATRLEAPSRDGRVTIPISVVRHKDTPVDGSAPLFLSAYGAYGFSSDPSFRSTRLSLLDRGKLHLGMVPNGEALRGHGDGDVNQHRRQDGTRSQCAGAKDHPHQDAAKGLARRFGQMCPGVHPRGDDDRRPGSCPARQRKEQHTAEEELIAHEVERPRERGGAEARRTPRQNPHLWHGFVLGGLLAGEEEDGHQNGDLNPGQDRCEPGIPQRKPHVGRSQAKGEPGDERCEHAENDKAGHPLRDPGADLEGVCIPVTRGVTGFVCGRSQEVVKGDVGEGDEEDNPHDLGVAGRPGELEAHAKRSASPEEHTIRVVGRPSSRRVKFSCQTSALSSSGGLNPSKTTLASREYIRRESLIELERTT